MRSYCPNLVPRWQVLPADQVCKHTVSLKDVRAPCVSLKSSLLTWLSFKPDLTNVGVVDWQKIRLQEQAVDDAKDEGRVPRTIECELTEVQISAFLPHLT